MIAQVRALVQSKEGVWDPETLAGVRLSLADALEVAGEQSGTNEPLAESIELYRKVLDERTRGTPAAQWALIQMNLGKALWRPGDRESGTAKLEEAVSAFREALQAGTQEGLGLALWRLGERESGTAKLEEVVSAYREALQENTLKRVSLEWARSTGNQGLALMLLGERRGDAKMAKLAVQQIETAFTTSRDGGDAPSAAYYEAQLPMARALAQKLAKR